MRMTGLVREMRNGWNDTIHLLPPMTHWNGYNHVIPADLEWSTEVPDWVASIEFNNQTAYKVNKLISVDGIEPKPCPFTGKPATWESCDGFIGAMAYQKSAFSLGGALRTPRFTNPQSCAEFWNQRAE